MLKDLKAGKKSYAALNTLGSVAAGAAVAGFLSNDVLLGLGGGLVAIAAFAAYEYL